MLCTSPVWKRPLRYDSHIYTHVYGEFPLLPLKFECVFCLKKTPSQPGQGVQDFLHEHWGGKGYADDSQVCVIFIESRYFQRCIPRFTVQVRVCFVQEDSPLSTPTSPRVMLGAAV